MKTTSSLFLIGFLVLFPAQLLDTSLRLTVRDGLGNTVEGASVKLYDSQANYTASKNAIAEGITNKKGVCVLKKLNPISYYLQVEKGEMNNRQGGEKIAELKKGRINKSTVVIE